MEQYLYTYLNQKYGLKSLVVEQAKAHIHAINSFAESDPEIDLFRKVLMHEINEEFRYAQLSMSQNLNNALKYALRQKFPLKANSEIQRTMNDMFSNKILIDHSIQTKLLCELFPHDEVELLLQCLRQKASGRVSDLKPSERPRSGDRRKATSRSRLRGRLASVQVTQVQSQQNFKVSFYDLNQTVLGFHL